MNKNGANHFLIKSLAKLIFNLLGMVHIDSSLLTD